MAVFQHSLEINLLHSKVSISSILLSLSTDLWCPWMVNLQDFSLNSATLSSTLLLTVIPMTWSAIKYGQQLTRLFFKIWKQEHSFLLTPWLNWKTKRMWTHQSGYTRSIIHTKCTWSFYTEAMKHLYRKWLACALMLPVALPATSSFE